MKKRLIRRLRLQDNINTVHTPFNMIFHKYFMEKTIPIPPI